MMNNEDRQLQVAYLNVNGLSEDKWRIMCEYLLEHLDILFLAETWYINQMEHVANQLTLISTTPARNYDAGRQHGGMLCLVHPDVRPLVSSLSATHYTISIQIATKWI